MMTSDPWVERIEYLILWHRFTWSLATSLRCILSQVLTQLGIPSFGPSVGLKQFPPEASQLLINMMVDIGGSSLFNILVFSMFVTVNFYEICFSPRMYDFISLLIFMDDFASSF